MAELTRTRTGPEAGPGADPGDRPVPRRRRSAARREALAGYAFISPWIVGFCVFTVGAMVYSLVISFSRYNLATNRAKPVGLKNYRLLLEDPAVARSLGNTLFFAVMAVPLEIVFALLLAVLLTSDTPVNWIGTAKSPDGEADVLEIRTADGTGTRLLIDSKTRMPLMLTWTGVPQDAFAALVGRAGFAGRGGRGGRGLGGLGFSGRGRQGCRGPQGRAADRGCADLRPGRPGAARCGAAADGGRRRPACRWPAAAVRAGRPAQ